MPFDYQISPEEGLATIRLSNQVTKKDLLGAVEALRADHVFSPDMHRLWDLRGVTEMVLELNQMHDFKASVEPISGSGRTAIVAVRAIDEIAAHFFRLYLKKRPIQVFRSINEARAWLLDR